MRTIHAKFNQRAERGTRSEYKNDAQAAPPETERTLVLACAARNGGRTCHHQIARDGRGKNQQANIAAPIDEAGDQRQNRNGDAV